MNGRSTQIHSSGVAAYHRYAQGKDGAGEVYALAREGSAVGFCLYLLFVVSWFLHLPARLPVLGAIRFDFLLAAVIFAIAFLGGAGVRPAGGEGNSTDLILKVLCVCIVLFIPFQTWPGSALFTGLPNFIKAVVFYYFTVWFVTNERRLKAFIAVFVACQCFRVLEPVYMHITIGYWGDKAYMDEGRAFMNRLSGAPNDIVNPNGLAFIIDTAVAMLYYLAFTSTIWAFTALLTIPICLYAIVLTGSRGGMIGIITIMVGIVIKSKHRSSLIFICVMMLIVGFVKMDANDKDRYLSIVDANTKNADTAGDRVEQITRYLPVVFDRPVFGHGIGTSREANVHLTGHDQPAHDLYIEIGEELGIVGLIVFILFMVSIYIKLRDITKVNQHMYSHKSYLQNFINFLQIFLLLAWIFSFASYGLSLDTWYLIAGLTVVVANIMNMHDQMRDKIGTVKVY